ncbi:MAG: hypothetical protein ACE5I5_12555 [Candidatus Heimdallarchaeota archaeon]
MNSIVDNPFDAVEYELNRIKFKKDDKEIEARHFHIRYVVGETEYKHYVGKGDTLEPRTGKTLLGVHIIHKIGDAPFHWDDAVAERLVNSDKANKDRITYLKKTSFNEEHPIVEIAFENPESCGGFITKDEVKDLKAGLVYWAGYHVDTSGGFIRLALAKTVDDEGNVYFDGIHVIPESIIRSKKSLVA